MWSYYLFMALLVTTLVLWAIIALRDDTCENGDAEKKDTPAPSDSPKQRGS